MGKTCNLARLFYGPGVGEQKIKFFRRINIIPGRNKPERKIGRMDAFQSLYQDPVGTPFDVLEDRSDGPGEANEIVTTIGAGAQDHVSVGKDVEGLMDVLCWERRDIGAYDYGSARTSLEALIKGQVHAIP